MQNIEIKFYNTLTRKKEIFKPIDKSNIRIYACGPTLYDVPHIGNLRPIATFDVLYRLLRCVYGKDNVTYVRNITDIDDKIIDRAQQNYPELSIKEAIKELTNPLFQTFKDLNTALGSLEPNQQPRVTDNIFVIKQMIDLLIEKSFAYTANNHVLFDVTKAPKYGQLSGRKIQDMQAGARVDVANFKRNPHDFVLWKPAKPGEPAWNSPIGIKIQGRPGWHIECSAMSMKYLSEPFGGELGKDSIYNDFDIHCGGMDLIFPHHDNEIAQSCSCFSNKMANYWLHNNYILYNGKKMSKSLGNTIDLSKETDPMMFKALRLLLLQTHYRKSINFTHDLLQKCYKEVVAWSEAVKNIPMQENIPQEILESLANDLNTPLTISHIRCYYKNKHYEVLYSALLFLGFI